MTKENTRSSLFLFVSEFPSVSQDIRCLNIDPYLSNRGFIYLYVNQPGYSFMINPHKTKRSSEKKFPFPGKADFMLNY